MSLVTFFLIVLYLPGKLLIHKASLYYRYTIFIDWRTQHFRDVNAPKKAPKQTHTYTAIWL